MAKSRRRSKRSSRRRSRSRSRRSCKSGKLRVHVKKSKGRKGYYKCVKDKGSPGRGPKLFSVKKGGLHPYRLKRKDGQSGYLKSSTRRDLLMQTHAKGKDWTEIGRSLNALYVYNKNTNKTLASLAKADSEWAFKKAKKAQKGGRKRRTRTSKRRRKRKSRQSSKRSKRSSKRKRTSKPKKISTTTPFPFNMLF